MIEKIKLNLNKFRLNMKKIVARYVSVSVSIQTQLYISISVIAMVYLSRYLYLEFTKPVIIEITKIPEIPEVTEISPIADTLEPKTGWKEQFNNLSTSKKVAIVGGAVVIVVGVVVTYYYWDEIKSLFHSLTPDSSYESSPESSPDISPDITPPPSPNLSSKHAILKEIYNRYNELEAEQAIQEGLKKK